MKKTIINKFLLLAFTLLAITMFGFVSATTSARADSTAVDLTAIEFKLEDGAYVRMGLDEENNPIIDEELNGIKFIAKMDGTEYENFSGKGVEFGILLMPYDYISDKDTVDEDLFFGENKEFYFADDEAFEGGKKIINVVTDKLAINAEGDAYYSASIVGIKPENKDREFAAISYVRQSDEYGVIKYDLKDFNKANNVRSMSYVAQKIVESTDPTYTQSIKDAVTTYYISNVTNTIDVNYTIAYGETSVDFTEKLTANLSDELGASDIVNLLEGKGVIDTDHYTFADAVIKQNGEDANIIKVYANDYTNEDVTINFVAKEVESLDAIKGYYAANGTEVVLKGDNTATFNNASATYKYFADGKVVIVQSGNVKVGTYDSETETLTIDNGGAGIALYSSVFLSNSATEELLGCYKTDAGLFIELKEDGEIVYDKCGFINNEENGSWVVYYDKTAEIFKMAVLASSIQLVQALDLSADSFELDGNEFTKVEVGIEEDYKAFANTYVAMRTFTSGTNAIESRLTFTEDGDVFYLDPAAATNLTLYESMGKYIILGDNQIQLKLKQSASDTIVTASYNLAEDKNTIEITLGNNDYTYESVHVTEEQVYAAIASEEGIKYSIDSNHNLSGSFKLYTTETTITKADVSGWKQLSISDGNWVSHNGSSAKDENAYKIEQVNNYMGYFTYYYGNNGKFYEGCYILVDGKYQIYMPTSPKATETYVSGLGLFGNGKLSYIISDIARLMNANSVATESDAKAQVMTMADVAGNYKVTNMYGKETTFDSSGWYAAFRFYDDGKLYYNGNSSYGTYELVTNEENPNLAEIVFNLEWDGYMTGYFVRIDGEIILRLRSGNSGIFNQNWLDYKKTGTKFSTWDVFSALAGDGSGEDGTEKVYVSADNKARIELQNDGKFAKMKLTHLDASTLLYYGAECKLVVDGNTYCARYDLLPLSATSGRMLVNVYGTELNVANSSVANKDFWADYKLVGKSYVINFTFNGVDYVMSIAGSNYVQNMIAGTYVGNNKLVLYSTSLADYGDEVDLVYSVIPETVTTGEIKIWATAGDVVGSYEVIGNGVRIVLNENGIENVYLTNKAQVLDLYAKFAGTYTSADWYKTNTEKTTTTLMSGISITLNADKTFSITDPDGKLFAVRDNFGGTKTGKYEIKLVDGVYCIGLYFDDTAFMEWNSDGNDWREVKCNYYERSFVGCFDANGNIVMNFRSTRTTTVDLIARTYVKQA